MKGNQRKKLKKKRKKKFSKYKREEKWFQSGDRKWAYKERKVLVVVKRNCVNTNN